MPASYDRAAWLRLGKMLTSRRVVLGYARSLQSFAGARGIHYRLAWDIENARRSNYTTATLALVEVAYGLEHGSVDGALGGGEFRLAEPGGPAPGGRRPDPSYQAILDADGLTDGEKLDAIEAVEKRRARIAAAGFSERHQHAIGAVPEAVRILMARKRQKEDGGESGGEPA